jgi:gliding motility-associated lipoprotein GldD
MKRRSERAPWLLLSGIALFFLLCSSCVEDAVPKPHGYPRLDLPPESFGPWEGGCPFHAELPNYAHMLVRGEGDKKDLHTGSAADTACWCSLHFPKQRATVYMTYRRIANDLPELIGDAHAFKDKHETKAARIRSERVVRNDARVFGNLFNVDGDVASPIVFYLTDSTTHFLYGSLYFDVAPNGDSLQPVTDRIRSDMRHFAQTLSWR